MIALGLMLAMAGIILFIAGVAQVGQNRSFRNAQRVTGTVTHMRTHALKTGREYLLRLSYTLDGIAYEREVGVSSSEYDVIEIGDPYEVQYRPNKPKLILRPEDTNPKYARVFLLLGASLLVVGVALLFIIRLLNT